MSTHRKTKHPGDERGKVGVNKRRKKKTPRPRPRTPAHHNGVNDPRASGLTDEEIVEIGMNFVEGDPGKKEKFGGWF